MKLHLGCGQIYLDGYINIDYPLDHHSVQTKSVADKLADITKLKYKKGSISEVRLHHVFEHFDRSTACALLALWSSWLINYGLVRIEVPDYARTSASVFSPFTSKKVKSIGMRHIFGSQEAEWAVHYYGWTETSLSELYKLLGFEIVSIKKNSWKGTFNIEITGKKVTSLSKQAAIKACTKWLSQFMVDDSKGEKSLLNYWSGISKKQLETGWAK